MPVRKGLGTNKSSIFRIHSENMHDLPDEGGIGEGIGGFEGVKKEEEGLRGEIGKGRGRDKEPLLLRLLKSGRVTGGYEDDIFRFEAW